MMLDQFPELRALPVDQQLLLARELFQAACDGGPPLTPEETAFLDERLREYEANPDAVYTNAEVVKRLQELKRRRAERLANA